MQLQQHTFGNTSPLPPLLVIMHTLTSFLPLTTVTRTGIHLHDMASSWTLSFHLVFSVHVKCLRLQMMLRHKCCQTLPALTRQLVVHHHYCISASPCLALHVGAEVLPPS